MEYSLTIKGLYLKQPFDQQMVGRAGIEPATT